LPEFLRYISGMNLKRTFLYSLIGSVTLSALIGIGVILFGDFGNFEVRVLMTTLTITAASILGLACGAYLETGRGKALPVIGIVMAVAAAIMTFFIIWNVADKSETFIKAAGTVTLLALSCSHLSLLSLARLDKRFYWSRIVAFVCVWTLSAILIYIMWWEPESSSDLVARVIGVLSILIASATVITPVFHKLSADTQVDAIDAEIAALQAKIAELEARKAGLAKGNGG